MATTTMNISLPESMKTFVEERLSADEYGTVSEYMRDLIRADQTRREELKLEKLLRERLRSNGELEFDIEDAKAELHRRSNAVRGIDRLRDKLYSKYGKMPDSAELVREDRAR